MKHRLLLFLLAALLIAAGSSGSIAQAPSPALGDCGSVASGSWDSTSTWRLYSSHGAFDSSAAAPSSGKSAFVLTGTTVTCMTGSQNVKNLVIQSGATLRSNVTLPASAFYLKLNGPTVWVDGNFGGGPNDALSLETRYDGTITLSGGGTVNIAQVRPNSAQSGTMAFVFATNANINYAGSAGNGGAGIYTTRGTQTSSTITINPGVTVTFAPGSYFELTSSTSTLGAMNTTLNVNGTLHAPAGSVILADSARYSCVLNIGGSGIVNIGKNLTPYLSGGGIPSINIASGGALNILSGGQADFSKDSTTVTGAGTFALRAGATIKIGAPAGLDRANGPVRTTTATFDPGANYRYVGTGAQTFGAQFPNTVNNLTVDSTCVSTSSLTSKVNGTLTVNGTLNINSGTITIDTANVSGTLNVLNGGTVDFSSPVTAVIGTGTFALRAGAGMKIGATAGLDSASGPVRTAIASFDTAGSYSYVGMGVQTWGAMLPDSIRDLTIGTNSIDTVTVTDPKKVRGVLQIDGLLVDNGGLTSAGSAIVNGTYQMNDTSAVIPLATWNTNSTCLVTKCLAGISTGLPNGSQDFYHFTFDYPTLSGVPRLGFHGNTLRGNLTIHNANTDATGATNFVVMCRSGDTTSVTVLGNLVIDTLSGSFSIGYGSKACVQILDLKGDLISKGWLFMNGSGVSNRLLARGNIIIQNPADNSFRGHSSTTFPDSVVFCGQGVQKFLKPVALKTMTNLRYRVQEGSTLSLNDTTTIPYSGNGTFTVDPGATLVVGHPNGVNGSFSAAVAPSLSSGASYSFNSSSAQVTGMWFPGTVKNLTINDSLGVTLSDTVNVTGTLLLTKGNLVTTDTSMVAIGPAGAVSRTNNYVVGRMTKQFTAQGAKDFEVGTANGYSPVTVNVTAGSGAMTVAAIQGQHPDYQYLDSTKTLGRYWTLNAGAGITKADLKFSYPAWDVRGNESIYGAWRYSGGVWTALPSNNHVPQHYVTTVGVTSFSDWLVGESPMSTIVKSADAIPATFFVSQNYPNPFNPTTTISYGLPNEAYVTITIYNTLGQEVATLQAGHQQAGFHTLVFDGNRFGSGVYFYRVVAGKSIDVKRMMLVK